MARILLCVALVITTIGLAGCVTTTNGPVSAAITVDTKGPIAVGDTNASATKVGRAEAQGIIIVATGDASISAAAREGEITRIHHVDVETMNILGIYARSKTIVYGE